MSKSKGRKGSKTDPMDGLPSKPRLCNLDKGSGGYGFNLHGEKGKHGQFIRAVDPGSPADLAGIKPGDRVIEVSGTNIERETHSQVVARIRADGGSTILLVADRDLDGYCKEHNITIKEDMMNDDDDEDDKPLQVNGINGSTDAVVESDQTPEHDVVLEPKKEEEEERIEATEEVREESQPASVPDPEPEPEPETAQEPEVEEETRPEENDVDAEIVAVIAADVQAEPEREPSPEPEPEREPTPEPVRDPTPEPVREPTPPPPREPTPPPPREPTPPPPREPTPPPPEPQREPTPPPPEEVDTVPIPLPVQKVSAPPPSRPTSAPKKSDNASLDLSDMSKARALAAGQRKKKQAAQQDWRSKYNAFNQL